MVRLLRENWSSERWRLLCGFICVALLIFAGTLSVAHGHDDGSIDHADCSLCATAHVTVQQVATLPEAPVTLVFTRVEAGLPALRPRTIERHSLFTRPPPANSPLTF